jgi:universal protein Kae1
MISLGIESTAHTFGVGVVKDGKILSSEFSVYRPEKGWGIIPLNAAKFHVENSDFIIQRALEKAGIGAEDVDIISFSQGPGLPPCLKIGLAKAKEFSEKYGKPIVPVNHCISHIEVGRLTTNAKDPVTVYVSGGNTQILAFSEGRYRCFGETMDIGLGNALDKTGREIGLDFPAGPKIEALAKNGNWIDLPYVVKGMDLSFSGIVTECVKRHKAGEKLENICFSLQETCFAMLTEVTERALAHLGKNEILLTGGVAANKRLQEMLKTMCEERGASFHAVQKEYSGDNGAMIAYTGLLMHTSGRVPKILDILPSQRTDDVEVTWI